MLMTTHIDPAVQANVDLSPDQSNHINLEGGGDLSFQYTPQGDMFLNGRYTLSGGTIKYSIPVIPLKEFNVQEGSYVQWTGTPMDPTLHLTATERDRTSVTQTGQSSPRWVNFDGRIVEYDVTELDELTLAYATTIHKAQGSEYPIVVMPVLMNHFVMLQRNLIYTGITRAKKILVLVGTRKALSYAVRNVTVTKRNTLLKERLQEKF